MAGKKIKLEEEADTDSESGAEASEVEDYFEEEEQQQQQQASAEVIITNTGQRNHQPNCAAVCVLLVAKERAQCKSVPDVTWACAWYLFYGISHKSKFVIYHPHCEYCVS